jgi:succinate dehydrogenase / fumarate reductase cytochrome b subunit
MAKKTTAPEGTAKTAGSAKKTPSRKEFISVSAADRPLSPHISIYKPQITSVMSISHRLTGIANTAGSLLLVIWLWAAAYNPEFLEVYQDVFENPLAKVALIGLSFFFFYHFCNGIRHLFWDAGYGFAIPNVYRSGYTVIVAALFMTGVTWFFACS